MYVLRLVRQNFIGKREFSKLNDAFIWSIGDGTICSEFIEVDSQIPITNSVKWPGFVAQISQVTSEPSVLVDRQRKPSKHVQTTWKGSAIASRDRAWVRPYTLSDASLV
jgi:hypothetical protein